MARAPFLAVPLVLGFPGFESDLALDLVEQPPPPLVPGVELAGSVDGLQRGLFGSAECLEIVLLVSIPAPGRPLDSKRR